MNRDISPMRKVVAWSKGGTAILDCGHFRGLYYEREVRRAEFSCDACQEETNDQLKLLGLSRGDGIAALESEGGK